MQTLAGGVVKILAGVFALPLLLLAASWWLGDAPRLTYFIETGLLAQYATNSVLIALGAVGCSLALAIPTAWWVTMYRFPGRSILQWALALPLAVPSYIAAMVYGYLLEGAGPVQHAIREASGLVFGQYPFPQIRSSGGMIFVLSLTLYPYLYLMLRGAFLMQSHQMLETAAMLGCRRSAMLTRLSLPMARPALAAGCALIFMESFADYGVAALYGVPVLSTGIFRAWQGFYDPLTAARLASLLLLAVLAVLWLEQLARGSAQYRNVTALYHPLERWHTGKRCGWGMTLFSTLPVVLGFALPAAALLWWGAPHLDEFASASTLRAMYYSLLLASGTVAVTLLVGLACAYALSARPSRGLRAAVALATSGYALPGTVLAVAVLLLFILIQNHLLGGALLLTGSLAGIIWGCSLRFVTISHQSFSAGLERITPAMRESAQMLGASRLQRLREVYWPLLSASAALAALLVFVDTLKELPATLLLRPFNVTTLSIRVYEMAKDDMLFYAAPLALLLLLLSVPAVLVLTLRLERSRPSGLGANESY